ncbi:MAG: Hsp20/alpha crystallin family protein [Kiritimatiellae bacterium]|nr:Hsp20/alpha crystallin family protein [Kiritimatiellia bacterium]
MLALTRWPGIPWSIFDEFEPVSGVLNRAGSRSGAPGKHAWACRGSYPLVNVWQADDDLIIDAELPGVDPADVEISVNDAELTISGKIKRQDATENESYLRRERVAGDFARRLKLPFKIEAGAVKASYKNGLLRVHLPRAEEEKPRRIEIEAT